MRLASTRASTSLPPNLSKAERFASGIAREGILSASIPGLLAAFQDALDRYGAKRIGLITPFQDGAVDFTSYERLIEHFIGQGVDALFADPNPPSAIFAANDFIALGVIDRLKGMGLSVPEDVSVIGFDDIPDAQNEVFSLSTLRQDTQSQARAAVASLEAIIAGKQDRVRRHIMPVELILRRSTTALTPRA